MRDLKPVYKAPTEEAGLLALDKLEEKWGKSYPYPIKSWRQNWNNLAVFQIILLCGYWVLTKVR